MDRHAVRHMLRHVEVERMGDQLVVRDPTGLAPGALVASEGVLVLLSLLDGTNTLPQIQATLEQWTGDTLPLDRLEALIEQLESAGFLEGPAFEAYYETRLAEYRRQGARPMGSEGAYGAPVETLPRYLDAAIEAAEVTEAASAPAGARLRGIVAPHLDFPRGLPCYAAAYRALAEALGRGPAPRRVVVLATNHWGRSRSVVATGADFDTPWGVVPTDREFLERLQARCGGDLMPYELDHLNEHSVELQVVWLRHLLGSDFRIVPVLCPDPSGPRGTAPGDPGGVDLARFSRSAAAAAAEDGEPTLFVASADLSHVGRFFGDEFDLDDPVREAVRSRDAAGLMWFESGDAEAYRRHMAATGNPTRVCSVGCLYAILTALEGSARPQRLAYHQAVTPEAENCVTAAAYAFFE